MRSLRKKTLHGIKSKSEPYQKHFSAARFFGQNLVNNYSQMPCPFTGPKMFCPGPIFLSQPKN